MTFIKNNSYFFVLFILCIAFTMIGVNKLNKEAAYLEITVSEGDSLWALAHQHADNRPVNEWIEDVVKLNDLATSTIHPGTELRLPSYEKLRNKSFDNQIAESGQ